MTRIYPRMRPKTAIASGGVIVPSRRKLGLRIAGTPAQVDFTGPSAAQSVSWSGLEAGRLYQFSWRQTFSSGAIFNQDWGNVEGFDSTPHSEDRTGLETDGYSPTFGYQHWSVLQRVPDNGSVSLRLSHTADAPADFQSTYDSFFARLVTPSTGQDEEIPSNGFGGPYDAPNLDPYWLRWVPWEIGFNIDTDPEPDIWLDLASFLQDENVNATARAFVLAQARELGYEP